MQNTDALDQAAQFQAKTYMGKIAWPTVILGSAVFTSYIAVLALVATGGLSLLLALPLITVLTYAAYTVMHEAVHGSISGSVSSMRWLNDVMGYLAGWILMIPLTAHRHEHLAHHRNTNQPDSDPDYVIAGMTQSPLHAVAAALRTLRNQYKYYFSVRWRVAPRSQNLRFCLEIAAALSLRLAFMAQGLWLEGAVLFVVGSLGGVIVVMYLFAYIVHKPHTAVGRYVDTSTIALPGPMGKLVTALWGFQNYHSIHHLFPRVPFYSYQKLYQDIEDIMIAKGAPIYSVHSSGLKRRPGLTTQAA
jgi:beta-carotene hydroxylase